MADFLTLRNPSMFFHIRNPVMLVNIKGGIYKVNPSYGKLRCCIFCMMWVTSL